MKTKVISIISSIIFLLFMNILFGDSPMFRGNPQHTGFYNGMLPQKHVSLLWRFQAGGKVVSSPALVNGILYIGCEDGKLYALNAKDGKMIWSFKTEGALHSSPAVAEGLVYFCSRDGRIYALDTANGQEKWRFETEGERWFEAKGLHFYSPKNQTIPDVWDYFLSSPLIWQNTVFCGSGDGNLYALERQTGKLIWKHKTGDVVHASPAAANGIVYIGSWDTFIYALDAASGKELWRFKTEQKDSNHTGIQSSPVIADGTVYFGCRDGKLYALDARSGKMKWQKDHKGTWVNASPAVANGIVYYGTSIPATVIGLDAATGNEVFAVEAKGMVFSSPALAKNGVLVGSFAGNLVLLDNKSGALLWEFRTLGSRRDENKVLTPKGGLNYDVIFKQPFFADDYYFENSFLLQEKLLSAGSILSSPILDNGVIYFGSTDNGVYALK